MFNAGSIPKTTLITFKLNHYENNVFFCEKPYDWN